MNEYPLLCLASNKEGLLITMYLRNYARDIHFFRSVPMDLTHLYQDSHL